jgi:hypothetical protein
MTDPRFQGAGVHQAGDDLDYIQQIEITYTADDEASAHLAEVVAAAIGQVTGVQFVGDGHHILLGCVQDATRVPPAERKLTPIDLSSAEPGTCVTVAVNKYARRPRDMATQRLKEANL